MLPGGVSAVAFRSTMSWPGGAQGSDIEALWQHSRNSVGIARLLLHEQRPVGLLDTACRAAMEYACRAALQAAGQDFPGDVARSLERLAAPPDVLGRTSDPCEGLARLAAAERVVAWASAQLRRMHPDRAWRY
jgi:hypothetical protein